MQKLIKDAQVAEALKLISEATPDQLRIGLFEITFSKLLRGIMRDAENTPKSCPISPNDSRKAFQIDRLASLAQLGTDEIERAKGEINSLLKVLTNSKFGSKVEIQGFVLSIRELIHRGDFKLVLTESRGQVKKGTFVSLSYDRASKRYPLGRMVAFTHEDPQQFVRGTKFLPLSIQ